MVKLRSSRSATRMRELAARKRMIEQVLQNMPCVSAQSPKNNRAIILHGQSVGLKGLTPPPSRSGSDQRIDEAVWNNYIEELRIELPTIEPELKQLETEFQDRLAEAESILDYYLDKPE